MTITSAAITLFLVMDPLGNIPVFLSTLATVAEKRRNIVLLREAGIAFVILTLFLFFGKHIMHGLGITQPALHIAGGIILFLIALKMIFPHNNTAQHERQIGEPFIVPMAIPMLAGPSALATVMLFATHDAMGNMLSAFLAVAIASLACTGILLLASLLRRLLGQRGLIALERLMGMMLTTIAVQMFLNGIEHHAHLS